jgi:hypothetical protein
MLRMATLEPEVAPMFEDRVIRRLQVQQVKESLNYWSPALIGACIASIVVFVTLHLVSTPSKLDRAHLPNGEARSELVQKLELDHIPVLR